MSTTFAYFLKNAFKAVVERKFDFRGFGIAEMSKLLSAGHFSGCFFDDDLRFFRIRGV